MITLSNVALRRGPKLLFANANAHIPVGAKVGLVGRNGSGKSSLLAALLGELTPDTGNIDIPAKLAITVLRQEAPSTNVSALQFVKGGDEELERVEAELAQCSDGHRLAELYDTMSAIDGYTADVRAAKLIVGLGFAPSDVERPVDTFSGGWRMRLNLAQTLMCRSEILLLDEPTNHLDFEAVVWLESWLKSYTGALVVISHDREFLDNVIERVFHLDGEALTEYTGNYSAFERIRAERLAYSQAAKVRQDKEIQRISRFVERFRAKANKARQAQSRLKALERMEKFSVAHVNAPFSFVFSSENRCPDTLVSLEDVSAGYGDSAPVLETLELTLNPGLRLGILGVNGAGKSTLMRVLAGLHTPRAGRRTTHPETRIGYFAQHQMDLLDSEATPLLHLRRQQPAWTGQRHRDYLGGFGFRTGIIETVIDHFSGGERARLVLALLVAQGPNVLLLDEPTNHLDLEMRHALEVALQDFEGALVLVSHDRHLLRAVTDELVLVRNGRVQAFTGDIESYERELTPDTQQSGSVSVSGSGRKEQRRQAAEERQRKQPVVDRLKRIEVLLERFATEQTRLDILLSNASMYEPANKAKLEGSLFERARAAQRIEELENEWLTLEEALNNT